MALVLPKLALLLTNPVGKTLLILHEKIEIGNTSVTILTDICKPTRAILLCDQKLHTLQQPYEDSINFEAPLFVNNIYLMDSENLSFQQGTIDAMVQSISGTSKGLLFFVDGKQARPASLSFDVEPSMIPRRIAIDGTPKRVRYSPELDKLIVLYHTKDKINLAGAPGIHEINHQRCVRYSIAFVDFSPRAFSSYPGETCLESSVVFNQFQPGEIALGVIEWFPLRNNQVFHVFVVNTLQQQQEPLPPSGRIYIFKKSAAGILVVKKIFENEAPVLALAPYGSHSLLYSCGADICLHTLSTKSDSFGWKFKESFKFSLLSHVRYISVCEPWVYVSTIEKSLFIFRVDGKKLVLQFVDEIGRNNMFHLTIPQRSLVMTCQTGGLITGLWQPSEAKGTTELSTIFEARLPVSITRLRRIKPSPWKQYLDSERSVIAVGSTTDGSFYQFSILDENAWRLLAFVQALALRSPAICPFVNPIAAYRCPLEPLTDPIYMNPLDMHIDGDILRRILERGGETSLIEMISPHDILEMLLSHNQVFKIMLARFSPTNTASIDHSLESRIRMATEIAKQEAQKRQSMMRKFAQGVGLEATDEKDLVAGLVQWMIRLMQKVI